MIYLDNAATTLPKPEGVAQAVVDAMGRFGNPSRGAHDPALEGLRCMMETRQELASLLGVADPMQVAFAMNATAALNIAIGGIGGHIITTSAEHNSVLRPVYRRGNHTILPLDPLGRLDMDRLEAAVQPDTEAVVMTHASNVTGNVFDIAAAGEICRRRGLRLIVDGAQTAGLLPIDVEQTGIAALCFSGHKSLYGPQGTGGIALGEGFQPQALAVGGSGSESFSPTQPVAMPDALEAGTQNAHGIAGLLAGIRHVKEQNGRCFADADQLARRFIAGVRELDGFVLYGDVDAPLRTPVVTLNHKTMDSGELAFHLYRRHDIAVRAGAHCAPLMHRSMGTETAGAVRFSFSHLNTTDHVEQALAALADLV